MIWRRIPLQCSPSMQDGCHRAGSLQRSEAEVDEKWYWPKAISHTAFYAMVVALVWLFLHYGKC